MPNGFTALETTRELVELRQGANLNMARSYDILNSKGLAYRFNAQFLDNHLLLYVHSNRERVPALHQVFGVVDITPFNADGITKAGEEATKRLLEKARSVATRFDSTHGYEFRDLSDEETDYTDKLHWFGRSTRLIP